MSTHTYAERYVTAVARAVPASARDEIVAEVEASIADQVEPLLDAGRPRDEAERAVVAELGEPRAYAASLTDRPMHLIGPRYYAAWLRVLKVLLAVVLPFAALGVTVGTLLQGGDTGAVIGAIVVTVLQAGVHVAFWTTLVFFILERTGSTGDTVLDWNPDMLPQTQARGAAASDFVATVVMAVILGGAFVWDRFIGWGDDNVHLLASELWPVYAVGFLVILGLTVVVAGIVLAHGRWTVGLAAANAVLAVITVVFGLVLTWQDRVLAADFLALLGPAQATVAVILKAVFSAILLGVLLTSAIDPFRRVRRG